jgi:hypothetical protein
VARLAVAVSDSAHNELWWLIVIVGVAVIAFSTVNGIHINEIRDRLPHACVTTTRKP